MVADEPGRIPEHYQRAGERLPEAVDQIDRDQIRESVGPFRKDGGER